MGHTGGIVGRCLAAVLMAAYLWKQRVPLQFLDQGALFFPVGALIGTLAGAVVARRAGVWLFVTVPLGFIIGDVAAMLVFFRRNKWI